MKVLISGASGLIGSALSDHLKKLGHTPLHLVRRSAFQPNEIEWHPGQSDLDPSLLDGVDAIVNLAGATTGRMPWTKAYKRELIDSRIESTKTLVAAMSKMTNPPRVFISGSASGFYGDTGSNNAVETDPKGTGFLSDLAASWEQEALKAPTSVRVVLIRTTMVLSRKLGALGRLLPLLRLGVGGNLGPGNQWWAWISLEDEVRAIMHLIETETASGPFNLTAPEPATCKQVVQELARQLKRPAIIPVPSFALRLAFGEAADELLICNQKMNPQKLLDSGFEFSHPTLVEACRWVLAKS